MPDLDWDTERFRRLLYRAADWVVRFYSDLGAARVGHGLGPETMDAWLEESLPEEPVDMSLLLQRFERDVVPAQSLNVSPRFFGYVVSGGNQAGVVASLLAAGLDACGGKWRVSAAEADLARVVVRWIAEFLGLDGRMGGVLTSGGSTANLLALHVARVVRLPFDVRERGLHAGPPSTIYVSTEGHSSIQKSVELLGIGAQHLRRVPVRTDLTMDPEGLHAAIEQDLGRGLAPLAVVATAGTTNTGAVDPLVRIASVCTRFGLWLHVDGAYGAPAAAAPTARSLFRGLELADSVTVDPHKWLYVPFEAGCLLVKHYEDLRRAFGLIPPYLAEASTDLPTWDSHEYSFQLSRDLKALKIWMTFLAYGSKALAQAIEDNILTMRHLARRIEESLDFELVAPVPLSTVCFQYRTTEESFHGDDDRLDALNQELLRRLETDGRVLVAASQVRGRKVIRACCVNHRTRVSDVEDLLKLLRKLGRQSARDLWGLRPQGVTRMRAHDHG